MNSRRFLSLMEALWAALPLPEWLPGAGERSWQQTVAALLQLWQEVGQFGVVIGGPVSWWPPWVVQDPLPQLPLPMDALHLPRHSWEPAREPPWLFSPDFSPESILTPGQTVIPLLPRDPLVEEPFLLLLTPVFSAVAAQGHHPHTRQRGMMVSFEPEVIRRAWQSLEQRVQQGRPDRLAAWQELARHYPLMQPHRAGALRPHLRSDPVVVRFRYLRSRLLNQPIPSPGLQLLRLFRFGGKGQRQGRRRRNQRCLWQNIVRKPELTGSQKPRASNHNQERGRVWGRNWRRS